MEPPPVTQRPFLIKHTLRLLSSFHHWTGRALIPDAANPERLAEHLYLHTAVVLSHGVGADPILNYGNAAALRLWEMTWEAFTTMPSRMTAEPAARDNRARLLADAANAGYLEHYQGIRVSRSGRRFLIEGALVWTVLDEQGGIIGQAAVFDRWTYLS
jgi:MEKHLA domain